MADLVDREAQLVALHQQLVEEVRKLRTGEEWVRWLGVAARLPSYSFNNILLILGQQPNATNVAGYRTWQSLGRQVDKGEKGLRILAPILRKPSPDDAVDPKQRRPGIAGYRVAHVWDLSQTSGTPLPQQPSPTLLQGQAPNGLWDALSARVAECGFTLERRPCHGANGLTNFASRTVRIRADVDDAQAVKTLAHELGHVQLHDPGEDAPTASVDCRGVTEVEAESIAYLVTASHGLPSDTYTFPYVTSWAASVPGTAPEDVVTSVGSRVTAAARQILAATPDAAPNHAAPLTRTAQADQVKERTAAVLDRASLPSASMASQETDVPAGRLLAVHADAETFFGQQLVGSWVPTYLEGRGLGGALDPDTDWRVGYAPSGWTTLVDHLRELGYSDDTLEASGLATRARNGRLVDRFRDRLTLPIHDDQHRVVAFVGRAHPDAGDRSPRYLNSPTTATYAKGERLLGAASVAARGRTPVLVEGPLDAVAVSLASPDRHLPLALCGTALTSVHAQKLSDLAGGPSCPVIVAMDADDAGQDAARAAFRQLSRAGLQPWAADLPPGLDPAAVLATRGGGLRLWSGLSDGARPLIDAIVDGTMAQWSDRLQWVEGRVGVVRALAPDLALLVPAQLDRQVQRLAHLAGVEAATVTQEVSRVAAGFHPPAGEAMARDFDVDHLCRATVSVPVAQKPATRGR